MKDISSCDCCKDIWNKDNLITFDLGKHGLYICPDCLEGMTNSDIIKAMFILSDIGKSRLMKEELICKSNKI